MSILGLAETKSHIWIICKSLQNKWVFDVFPDRWLYCRVMMSCLERSGVNTNLVTTFHSLQIYPDSHYWDGNKSTNSWLFCFASSDNYSYVFYYHWNLILKSHLGNEFYCCLYLLSIEIESECKIVHLLIKYNMFPNMKCKLMLSAIRNFTCF